MGRDKGALELHGEPQARWGFALLERVCRRAYLSLRRDHVDGDVAGRVYLGLPHVIDEGTLRGPAAGLLAAWRLEPDTAFLVLGVDMPLVDDGLLNELLAARDPSTVATAFLHPDGTPEPLCTVWEPAARGRLLDRIDRGGVSLRNLLREGPAKLIEPGDSSQLQSVNLPTDFDRFREQVDRRR